MQNDTPILLIAIIAILVVIVAVLLWNDLRHQRQLREKNDAIIREIRENVELRDELQRLLAARPTLPDGSHNHPESVMTA